MTKSLIGGNVNDLRKKMFKLKCRQEFKLLEF